MAVARVFAEADIADDEDVGVGVLEAAYGLLDDAIGRPGTAALFVLGGREAEEEDCRELQSGQGFGFGGDGIEAETVLPGHGGDGRTTLQTGFDEERVDEVGRCELGFTDEATNGG